MTITLRPYQQQSIDACLNWLNNGVGNPVLELATGLGKSIIIAGLVAKLQMQYPAIKILVLCHRAKLVEQDADKFIALGIHPAIYCAELGKKQVGQFITIGTIGSVARNAELFAGTHLIIVDEVQTISNQDEGQYRVLLKQFPRAKVVGLSATPYRMKGGAVYGQGRIFSGRCCQYGFGFGVKNAFLTPPINYDENPDDDFADVKLTAGDFNITETNAHFFRIVHKSCEDLVKRMRNRNHVLVFCCSIKHAESVVDTLTALGETARVYHSELSRIEDMQIIDSFLHRDFKYLVSIDKLGVGFDAPFVDALAMMRPTMSRGLAIQMLGRGSRLYPGKKNFLVADYAGNIRRHNLLDPDDYDAPVSEIKKPKRKGDAPFKKCPNCDAIMATRTIDCQECGYIFPPKLTQTASEEYKNEVEIDIKYWHAKVRENAKHRFVLLKIGDGTPLSDYGVTFFPEDENYARTKSVQNWRRWFGAVPDFNCDLWAQILNDNLSRLYSKAKFKKDGKYWNLISLE